MTTIVINADNRVGYKNNSSTVGDYGEGSLQGVRSVDLLTEGVKNKINYFRGHDVQCILYIDKHEDIESELMEEIKSIVLPCGNNSQVVFKEHNRTKDRWYDYITIEALKLATGDYIVHFDQDSNAIRTDDCDIVDAYMDLLDTGYKFICQPSLVLNHGMYWASTRFFICKKESLDLTLLENSLYTPLHGVHSPCLEHAIGILSGEGTVLYPPREDNKYLVWSWARYYKGTLKKLNEMNPSDALKYILDLGVHGASDVLDKV